jgi:hypothetical protein
MNTNLIKTLSAISILALGLGLGCNGASTSSSKTATSTDDASSSITAINLTVPSYVSTAATAKAWTTAQTGASYAWTISGDGNAKIATGQGTNAITISGFSTTSGTEIETVSLTVTGSSSSDSKTRTATFIVAPPPGTPTITPSITPVETTQQFTLTAYSSSASTSTLAYAWTITNGYVESGMGTDVLSVIAPNTSGTMSVACTVTDTVTGLTSTANKAITVGTNPNPAPNMPTITVDSSISGNGSTSLVCAITPQDGCTYSWACADLTIASGQGTSSVTFASPDPSGLGQIPSTRISITVTNANGSVTAYTDISLTE